MTVKGHGTFVAGILGGNTVGAAKQVTILSVKVCNYFGCPTSEVNAGVNFITENQYAAPYYTRVVNMSFGGDGPSTGYALDNAVVNSIASGVTYVISAGQSNDDAIFISPADVAEALTVGGTDPSDSRAVFPSGNVSNFGSVDLFAPGYGIVSALPGNDNQTGLDSGTSYAAPHVAGAVAMYLQGRTGTSSCSLFPIQGPASSIGSPISTCPDRIARFIDSNANLNRLININGYDRESNFVFSPNRFIWTGALPAPVNPVDNQRFYVWQQYADFLAGQPEPDENGLNFWTGNINGTCGTGLNDNNSCTATKRIDVSRAFWVAAYGSLFDSYGTTNNAEFVHLCYEVYLRRSVSGDDPGFLFWFHSLSDNYGNPANYGGVNNLINAFLTSDEYRRRFGQG